MDDDRQELSQIDRALAEALDVDASPGFAARVRQRIASEPAPTPFWHGWRIVVPVAVAAIAIAAAGVVTLSKRGPAAVPRLAARPIALGLIPAAEVHPVRPLTALDHPAPAGRPRAASVSATRTNEAEVLVPREEIEMYRRLIAAAQRVPHAMVVEAPQDIVAVRQISEITIDPIKIDLIVPPVGGEGDRQ